MRIVIKIGSHLLTDKEGRLDENSIAGLVKDIAEVHNSGNEALIVTSGAIACGVSKLGLKNKNKTLPQKQASAAVGQPELINIYSKCFSRHGIKVAQVLLTREDFENRNRYINARNTMFTLLELRVVPIINENDTISVEEIQIGENDTLSALVAVKVEADMLILLTDVDGLFNGDPNRNKDAKCIHEVCEITKEIEDMADSRSGSEVGTGGMSTKIKAAKIATKSGVETVIANGYKKGIIQEILAKTAVCTRFLSDEKVTNSRKRWIAFGTRVKGKIFVDKGAAEALVKRGKSLLPSGIVSVEGGFEIGDNVSVIDNTNREIARGLVLFSSSEINKIKGKKSSEISKILGKSDYEEVIHRDNLTLI